MGEGKDNVKYRCELPWQADQKASTLVVYCSAFDIRLYFREFLDQGLGLQSYDLIAVPGGAQILSASHFLPKVAGYLRRLVDFLVKAHKLERVVLLGHEDCGFYKNYQFGPVHLDLRERQIHDLRNAAETLRGMLGLPVEGYYARITGERVEFVTIQ